MKIMFIIFLLGGVPVYGFSQKQDPGLRTTRDETVKVLREFKDKLGDYPSGLVFETLRNYISDLINIAKTLKDTGQLRSLEIYFTNAGDFLFNASDTAVSKSIAQNINRDLFLKTHSYGDSSLHLGTAASFGTEYEIQVVAFINGKKQTQGTFRMYWGTFLSDSQESIIRAGKFEGSSNLFTNPYQLEIKLPGIITFWLQDVVTKAVYKSDFPYKRLIDKVPELDINFILLQ